LEQSFEDADIEDEARLSVCTNSGHVPEEGLQLWLSAKDGLDVDEEGKVRDWRNPKFASGHYLAPHPESLPSMGENSLGPYVHFGYHEFGYLTNPEHNHDTSLDMNGKVKTIISVHNFEEQEGERCQYYIFTGDIQGPLHSGGGHVRHENGGLEFEISSGDGSWAGGQNFVEGSIRLDGTEAKPVSETLCREFTYPRLAVVEMNSDGIESTQGQGLNRIGRDRDCHAFQGCLHEVMAYDRKLSEEEIAGVEAHLFSEWPKLSLPKPR